MTRPKVIYIVLFVVLAALASASVGFAQPAAVTTLVLRPSSGCPGTVVTLDATFPSAPVGVPFTVAVMSDPDGLITEEKFVSLENAGLEVSGVFTVSDSVCRRPYTVTVSVNSGTVVLESASVIFTTGGDACPRLPVCSPVGGVVAPTNKLALVTPYLALVGLVAAVSAVIIVKKRRHALFQV